MRYAQWTYRHPIATERRRVVITGLGAVCAAGIGVPALWEALLTGKSGIGPITRFDATGMESRIGGEVKDFQPLKLIEARLRPKRLSRQAQFSLVAASEALKDAKLTNAMLKARNGAVILGSVLSSLDEAEETALKVERSGARFASAAAVPRLNMQGQATALVEMLELENIPSLCVSTSCMGGIDAATLGASMIKSGQCDFVVCGGTDAPLSRMPAAEIAQAGLMSRRNDEPERASRPFDRERDNGLLAEGAGIIILEEYQAARDRGITPYVEILGSHTCRDVQGAMPGTGLAVTMRTALDQAGCSGATIDYISAWGCGDPNVDRYETESVKATFGAHAYDIAVGSIKAVTGNPFAAAGALQLIAAAMSYRQGLVPPTANYEHGDLDCDLDYIQGTPRRVALRHAIVNAHGLGGGNTSVVLGRAPLAG
jgi:3-oxoacyl-[acyl-carrier-protein] synthase II